MSQAASTACAVDDTLDIFGNANMDGIIDEMDIAYVDGIIKGINESTKLADANYDGKVDADDITQIKQIMSGNEKELTIIDTSDRIVTVKEPVNSVICTIPSQIEALRILRMPRDTIIAWGERAEGELDTDYFPEYRDVPCIGLSFSPDIEKILELNPDITFLATAHGKGTAHDEVTKKLEAAGITVLRFRFDQPELLSEEIEKIGYIFGKRDQAEEFIAWYENIMKSLDKRVKKIPEEDKPKVLFEYGIYEVSSMVTEMDDNVVAMAGGKEVIPSGGFSMNVDSEEVIKQNPDIIVRIDYAPERAGYDLDAGNTSGLEEVRDWILSTPELQNVQAVMNGDVYILSNRLLFYCSRAGNRAFIGMQYLAKWFHPDLFKDLDPQAIHQEYLTRFQGLDYDLSKHGVFAYPESS